LLGVASSRMRYDCWPQILFLFVSLRPPTATKSARQYAESSRMKSSWSRFYDFSLKKTFHREKTG
jgi:hypothetical protein